MLFKDMSDEELISEWQGYDDVITKCGCFGLKDLMNRDAIEVELYKRGYEPSVNTKWYKVNEDDKD